MSWFVAALSAAFLVREKHKEKTRPVIPASYWRNQELMNADKLDSNVSHEQIMRNLENGKYYLSDDEYARRNQPKDYSFHEGEDINSWMERLSRQQKERMDKLYGRKQ